MKPDIYFDCDDQSCVFSWQGGHHLEDNSPRQDRVAMAQLPSSQGKLVIVSDGLGSCHLSHLGAQLAIDAMRFPPWLKRWDDLLAKVDTTKEAFDLYFCKQVNYIRHLLTCKAGVHPKALKRDFATTLLVAAVTEKRVYAAMVGDGGIFRVKKNSAKLLIKPAETGASNIVVPITHSQWKEIGFGSSYFEIDADDCYICVMTDGFAESITLPTEYFQDFAEPLTKKSLCAMSGWFEELAKYYEDEHYSDDDKSLALVTFNKQYPS